MAHEITDTDGVVFHKVGGWHGLGVVVKDAPTPLAALGLAGMDWQALEWDLAAWTADATLAAGHQSIAVPNRKAILRSDTKTVLGIVGSNWKPFQNKELAEFAEALAMENDVVKVESAGSIRGGEKVWFLLKGESFSVRDNGKDNIEPYILLSNGFDGFTALRATPTTVRVQCSNTLHMVIPDGKAGEYNGRVSPVSYAVRHSGKLEDRVAEVRAALGLYGQTLETNKTMINTLAAKDVKNDAVNRFFLECFSHDFGGVADVPTTRPEINHRAKAMDAVRAMKTRFEMEEDIAGHTAWNMFNAYTGWLQNDRIRHKGGELRASTVLFGEGVNQTHHALAVALSV